MLSERVSQPLFYPEAAIALQGRIQVNSKPASDTPFSVVIPGAGENTVTVSETDSTGAFVIKGLSFEDSVRSIWRVMKKNDVARNARVDLSAEEPPVVEDTIEHAPGAFGGRTAKENIAKRTGTIGKVGNGVTLLEEITIEDKRILARADGHGGIFLRPEGDDIKT